MLTDTCSPDGSADGHNSLFLANDPVVKCLLHFDELLTFITAHLLNWNACKRDSMLTSLSIKL